MMHKVSHSNEDRRHLQPAKQPEAGSIAVSERNIHGTVLFFKTPEGVELRAPVVRLEPFLIVVELHQPDDWLCVSAVLSQLKLYSNSELIYTGRGSIKNLVNTGSAYVCEVNLDDPGFFKPLETTDNGITNVLDAYSAQLGRWKKQVVVHPDFKAVVFDLHSYLYDLKLTTERIEMAVHIRSQSTREQVILQMAHDLAPQVLAAIDALHERFEVVAEKIPSEEIASHQVLLRRQLHSFFLCAPFGYRTYHKPLGYAGDYEIMNMIHRNTFEGASLFAKLLHFWLVSQWAAKSVRNRIAHMESKLAKETARLLRKNRRCRILNIGCGPAREVQNFMAAQMASNNADFTLLDFDHETIEFARSQLNEIKRRNQRQTNFKFHQMSVMKLIANSQKATKPVGSDFDLIYCGGLFDYFSDAVCQQLMDQFYQWLAPEGFLVVANMSNHHKPFSRMVEFLLDWRLIYRSADALTSLAPKATLIEPESVRVEPSLVNMFLELRKPPAN